MWLPLSEPQEYTGGGDSAEPPPSARRDRFKRGGGSPEQCRGKEVNSPQTTLDLSFLLGKMDPIINNALDYFRFAVKMNQNTNLEIYEALDVLHSG